MKDQLDIYEENVASNYYLYLIESKTTASGLIILIHHMHLINLLSKYCNTDSRALMIDWLID